VALDDRNDHQAKLTETKGRIFYSVFTRKEKPSVALMHFFSHQRNINLHLSLPAMHHYAASQHHFGAITKFSIK